jgi:chemotaxis protein CheY-P-specific phosphatase CheC
MSPLKPEMLETIFSDVLANLAFMFTEDEIGEPSPDDVWLETCISYHGPQSGKLLFRCTRSFTVQLAANLLGCNVGDSQAVMDSEDAVKEFMNILCGQFVTIIHGTGDVFNLSIPETGEMPEMPDTTVSDDTIMSTLTVDGYRVQLSYEHLAASENCTCVDSLLSDEPAAPAPKQYAATSNAAAGSPTPSA